MRICIQSLEKMLIRSQNHFSKKIKYGYQNTQNFTLISNPLKFFLMYQKKLLAVRIILIIFLFGPRRLLTIAKESW
jgi:hypothetical protein